VDMANSVYVGKKDGTVLTLERKPR
jgi:hypothetical protein